MKGCVVGINTFGYTESEGLNFSIASSVANRFINKFSGPQLKASNTKENKIEIKSLCKTNNQICETDKEARKKIINADKIIAFNPKIEEAKKLASDSLAIQESDYAYMLRGKAKYFLEEDEEALEDLTRALRINPLLIEASFIRGLVYKESKNYSKSLRDFQWVIKKAKSKDFISKANLEIIDIKIQQNDMPIALQILEKEINSQQNKNYLEDLYLKRSEINLYTGNINESKKDANKILKLNSSSYQAYYLLGLIQYHLKDYQGAIQYFSTSIEINPNFSNAFMMIGDIQERVFKEHDVALKSLNKSIELDPKNAEAYILRGILLTRNYKLPRGCVDLKTGKDLKPTGFTANWYNNFADLGLKFSFCQKIYNE
jgi:tetratricopeptide (TPR) repeat protein